MIVSKVLNIQNIHIDPRQIYEIENEKNKKYRNIQ